MKGDKKINLKLVNYFYILLQTSLYLIFFFILFIVKLNMRKSFFLNSVFLVLIFYTKCSIKDKVKGK